MQWLLLLSVDKLHNQVEQGFAYLTFAILFHVFFYISATCTFNTLIVLWAFLLPKVCLKVKDKSILILIKKNAYVYKSRTYAQNEIQI